MNRSPARRERLGGGSVPVVSTLDGFGRPLSWILFSELAGPEGLLNFGPSGLVL
jgi:hypothetical protein